MAFPPPPRASHTSAIQRLQQDYMRLNRDPVPYIAAHPLPSNMFEWHYVVAGPDDSPYKGGYYHGKLIFPKEYPFRPPSILMITPSGRFACNTRLCLSISDFHPDTWNPAWSVSSILTGLLSFMLEFTPTMGSVQSSTAAKREFAKTSGEFNLKSEVFCELFPDLAKEIKAELVLEARARSNLSSDGRSAADRRAEPAGAQGHTGAAGQLPTLFVFGIFCIFAVLVKVVMQLLTQPIT